MTQGLHFLLAISIMVLMSIPIFNVPGNYAFAKITMSIDSKTDGDDIRTDIKIDTPDNTRIDETGTTGNDKVNIVTKTPRSGNGNENEQRAADEIKKEVRNLQDKCDPLLQNDLPDQDDADECEKAIEDVNNKIDEEQSDLPPP